MVLEEGLLCMFEPREMVDLLQKTEQNIQDLKQALEEDLQISRDLNIQTMKKTVYTIFTLALSASSLYLAYQSRDDQRFSIAAIGTGVAAAVFGLSSLTMQERPVSSNLENTTSEQHDVEERQLTRS